MIEIFEELDKFSHTKYYDPTHTYHINGKEAISTTTVIGKYKEPFNTEYWSNKKATDAGVDVQEILDDWDHKRNLGTCKGTQVHLYLEYYLNNKIYDYVKDPVWGDGTDPVKPMYDKIIPMVHQFCDDIKGKMIPIKSELVIGDPKLMISGMIDQLFFNIKSGKLEIWDWKTNKQILFDNPYKMKFPVNHLSTAELHAYSLQLSCYRYLIEKNTTLELGDSYLAWFNEKNDTYKTYKCFDFRPEIESLIKHYMANK